MRGMDKHPHSEEGCRSEHAKRIANKDLNTEGEEKSMKALICKDYGDPSHLVYEEVPSPTLQAGGVRIAVHAIGLNYADGIAVSGRSQLALPFSPGFECSGTVIECGREVQAFHPGDRVLAIMTSGAYTEEVVVPAAHVALLPPTMDMLTAAAFPVSYLTAYLALVHR